MQKLPALGSENYIEEASFIPIAEYFTLLSEPTCLHLISILCEEEIGLTVSEIVEKSGYRQPNVSRHLARLHLAGVLTRSRSQTSVVYCLADPLIHELCKIVYRRLAQCE
jgi:DNA-binding transcriptional ArsR family regulator